MPEYTVYLYIYDLSRGIASLLSPTLLGRQIDGVWHTSVVVYNREYFYGSGGVNYCCPGGTMLGEPMEKLHVGKTEIPHNIFLDHVRELGSSSFRGEHYKLFEHNCNTFSSEVTTFLTGCGIPAHITDLPSNVLRTPFGQMIRAAVENIKVNPASRSDQNI